ncbi:hypothetical protein M422DRAFT_250770 [Sphaerobolus stellatus SS14]|uniref:Unplaced genomic scaffold SPHSTscaffold_36, whole genome shotgun sequence n=1 Tax=Sphaerobolus stellatus (strain SS14) TaxID=990650 RepID=A0A0C9VSK0_SPHS4|nr:hypothetical protein M422DRAFT_250770 [Sphaerobolus stellatus SS14]
MSQATRSSNTAELLSRFRKQQAQCDEHHVEVGAIFGACFVYHPKGCNRCSSYLEHLLEDIKQCPSKFSFSKDEIMNRLYEAWPHITEFITDLNEERLTFAQKLGEEKADNCRLCSELDGLDEKIQELEARILSLQPKTPLGDQSLTVASNTDISSSDVSPHPLVSPGDRTYLHKRSRKLFENTSFQNHIQVPEKRPEYWSLYMWNTLKDWYTNPMSVPNTIRDNSEGYFLEDVDVAVWISKVAADISGFDKNLLQANHEATMWITDSATPLRIGTTIVKDRSNNSQTTKPERLPTGPDFLVLVLEHYSLTRGQIYGRIILYMIRHEAKCPCSGTGSERAEYMHLNQRPPPPHKGK